VSELEQVNDLPTKRKRPGSQAVHGDHVSRDGGYSTLIFEPVMLEAGEKLGRFSIEVCQTCSWIVRARCIHDVNRWDEAGTVLFCRLCGEDVT
jgi:hypothetical protein